MDSSDVTEKPEHDSLDALQVDQEEFFAKISRVAPTILYLFDLREMRNIWVNRSIFKSLGYDEQEVAAMGSEILQTLMHPDDMAAYPAHFESLMRLDVEETAHFEYRMRHKNGSWRWLASDEIAYARDDNGMVYQIIGSAYDITEARAREESIALLGREMNHRIKNLFAVIGSMISLTGRSKPDAPAKETLEVVRGRINALSTSHSMSIGSLDNSRPKAMSDLLTLMLKPYAVTHDIEITGSDPLVTAQQATSIGLILHELATNAMKYGALAQAGGRVEIDVSETRPNGKTLAHITWKERCPAPIMAFDYEASIGFGTTLIRRSAAQLSGTVTSVWEPDGLLATLSFPTEEEPPAIS